MELLIIKPGALGDTLMLAPALSDLGETDRVLVAGRYPGLSFLGGLAYRLLDFEARPWAGLFSPFEPDKRLPVASADRVIAFLSRDRDAVRQNLGYFFPGASVHVFPSFPRVGKNIHAADHVARCLMAAGLAIDPARAMDRAMRRSLLSPPGPISCEQTLLFHPGSGGQQKNHPVPFWTGLLQECLHHSAFMAFQKVVLLGPAEETLWPIFSPYMECAEAKVLQSPGPADLLHALCSAALFIGQDSGVSHLAAMVGTPTIALFKNSDPIQWRPLGPLVQVIQQPNADEDLIQKVMASSIRCLQESPFYRRPS